MHLQHWWHQGFAALGFAAVEQELINYPKYWRDSVNLQGRKETTLRNRRGICVISSSVFNNSQEDLFKPPGVFWLFKISLETSKQLHHVAALWSVFKSSNSCLIATRDVWQQEFGKLWLLKIAPSLRHGKYRINSAWIRAVNSGNW